MLIRPVGIPFHGVFQCLLRNRYQIHHDPDCDKVLTEEKRMNVDL